MSITPHPLDISTDQFSNAPSIRGTFTWVSVVPGFLALVLLVSLIAGQPGDFFGRDQESIGVDYTLVSTNAREFSAEEFAVWAANLVGSEIGWHGQVEQVRETASDVGLFELVVNVRGVENALERAHVQVPRDLALGVPAGAEIFFTGTIAVIDNTFPLTIDINNATIQEPDGAPFSPRAVPTEGLLSATEAEAANDVGVDYALLAANARELTDAQFEELAATVLGAEIRWPGLAEQVRPNPDDEALADVTVEVSGAVDLLERTVVTVPRAEALAIGSGTEVLVRGSIERIDNTLSLRVSVGDATVSTLQNSPVDIDADGNITSDLGDPFDRATLAENAEQLTVLQFEEWVDPAIDAEFTLTGLVARVEEADQIGEYQVVVNLGGDADTQAFFLTGEDATSIVERQVIQFSGTLASASNEAGLTTSFDDVSYSVE